MLLLDTLIEGREIENCIEMSKQYCLGLWYIAGLSPALNALVLKTHGSVLSCSRVKFSFSLLTVRREKFNVRSALIDSVLRHVISVMSAGDASRF